MKILSKKMEELSYDVFEKNKDVHYFTINDDIKKLLLKTEFTNNKIKLPFSKIRINVDYEDNEGNTYPFIYVSEENNKILIEYCRIANYSPYADFGFLEYNLDLTDVKKSNFQFISKDNKSLHRMSMEKIGDLDISHLSQEEKEKINTNVWNNLQKNGLSRGAEYEEKIIDESENKVNKFVGNFINLINSRDVELVTVEYSEEQNNKRVLKGKRPHPINTYIRLTGKIKEYVNKLNSFGRINYSYSFWVRGHWRTLRSKERFGDNAGTMLWIYPYIKGDGDLVKKDYEVTK